MKKIFYIGIFLGLLSAACQENEMKDFDSNGAVYFQLSAQWSNSVDSVVYSFAGKPEDTYTVKLQVNLMGSAADYERTVRVTLDKQLTTAKEGTHYDALHSSYTLPAGAYRMEIPIVLHGNDPELEERTFQIALKLEASDDLQLGLSKRTSARVIISKLFTKPLLSVLPKDSSDRIMPPRGPRRVLWVVVVAKQISHKRPHPDPLTYSSQAHRWCRWGSPVLPC